MRLKKLENLPEFCQNFQSLLSQESSDRIKFCLIEINSYQCSC